MLKGQIPVNSSAIIPAKRFRVKMLINPDRILRSQLPSLLPEAALGEGARQEPQIRPVDIKDLEAVSKFIRQQPWVVIYEHETIGLWKEMLQSPTCSIFMAEDFQKKVIGCAFCFFGPRGQISHFAIDSEYQGNGIGKKMLEAAIRWFKAKGINEVSVTVGNGNQDGKEFWLKHDFNLITAEGGPSVMMVKKI